MYLKMDALILTTCTSHQGQFEYIILKFETVFATVRLEVQIWLGYGKVELFLLSLENDTQGKLLKNYEVLMLFLSCAACHHLSLSESRFPRLIIECSRYLSADSREEEAKPTHDVWKSQKKSHSTLRAKRATSTIWVDKS